MLDLTKNLTTLLKAKNASEFVKREKLVYQTCDNLEVVLKNKIKLALLEIKQDKIKDKLKIANNNIAEKSSKLTDKQLIEIDQRKKWSKEELTAEAIKQVSNSEAFKAEVRDFKSLAYQLVDTDESVSIGWIDSIPQLLISKKRQDRKKAKKHLTNLIRIASLRNIMSWETIDSLKRQITLTKSATALKNLQEGEVIKGFQFPNLEERFNKAQERAGEAVATITFAEFKEATITKKSAYLGNKKVADRVAMLLNTIVSVMGVGLVSAIALVGILPALGITLTLPVAVGVLIGSALLGGYTEGFVFYGYIQKFCRQFTLGLNGFFEGIDNKVLNREAKRDRHDLSEKEIQDIKSAHATELTIKKGLVVLAFLLSTATGIGYMGLLFSELLAFIPAALLLSAPALVAVPWLIAGLVAPVYAIVMCGMLYKAIKDNYLIKVRDYLARIFVYENANEKYKKQREKEGKPAQELSMGRHIWSCIWKSLVVALVLSFSVVAIAATAGLWIDTTVGFIGSALGVAEKAAEVIGWVIGGIYSTITLWFCFEKSLETVHAFSQGGMKESLKDAFSSPKKFFNATCNLFLMLFHVTGNAAVAALGAESSIFKGILPNSLPGKETIDTAAAVAGDVGSELAIDTADNIHLHRESSYKKHNFGRFYTEEKKHDHHHGHSHGNLVKTGIACVKKVKSVSESALTQFGLMKAEKRPPLKEIAPISPRAIV